MKKLAFLCSLVCMTGAFAQQVTENDSIATDTLSPAPLKFHYKQLIIPSVLIGYGVIGIESDQLKSFNTQLRDEVKEDIDEKTSIDDFSQWAPAASVFALDALGIKAKNSLRDRSVILATSYSIMGLTTLAAKSITQIERPDKSANNSFPSGHTATAFAGAEFLMQEYKHESVWYGIAGYAVATGTGLFRIYNNKHWLTDVAAGAGIGILSTKAAYWINPIITKALFGDKQAKSGTSALMPGYDGRTFGLAFVKLF
ncbi:phosphatase PAP2 family protein [Flavobacterium sp. MFBS3-15]|uniref:phosphatase PAP2 family protein n=1 Tax=Flavobacterium sp. MFBS3-15 TaxID=2989816 RepID=UPI00223699E0|nr:phosphatase PAP2 family protein [Flavobacterium sp. MFBS3-15]MCW4468889.1 phosphatase PAP2 family protein [Flavobacterium sp. MFBS3-15]